MLLLLATRVRRSGEADIAEVHYSGFLIILRLTVTLQLIEPIQILTLTLNPHSSTGIIGWTTFFAKCTLNTVH